MVDPRTRECHIRQCGSILPRPADPGGNACAEDDLYLEQLDSVFHGDPEDDAQPELCMRPPKTYLSNDEEFAESTYLSAMELGDSEEACAAAHASDRESDADQEKPAAQAMSSPCHKLAMDMQVLQGQHHLSDSVIRGMSDIIRTYCDAQYGDKLELDESMAFVGTLRLPYRKTPICWNGCVVFAGAVADEMACPKCSAPRYGENGRECIARTLPMREYIQRFCRNVDMGEVLAYQRTNRPGEVQPQTVSDWLDGEKAREISRAGYNWDADLSFAACFDGFTDSKVQNTSYDAVVLRPMSLPPGLRSKKEMAVVYSILPRGMKRYDAVFHLFVHEMIDLWEKPITCEDKRGVLGTHRALCICVIADLKGIPHVSGCSTYPATRGVCHVCHVKGVHFHGAHRTLYPASLEFNTSHGEAIAGADHEDDAAKQAFRAGLTVIRGKAEREEFRRFAEEPLQPRTARELEKFANWRASALNSGARKDELCHRAGCLAAPECAHSDPWKLTGVKTGSCLAGLPLFDPVQDLCACSMHGFANVVKEVERHMRGTITSVEINKLPKRPPGAAARDRQNVEAASRRAGDRGRGRQNPASQLNLQVEGGGPCVWTEAEISEIYHPTDQSEYDRRDGCVLEGSAQALINERIMALRFPSGIQTPNPIFKLKQTDQGAGKRHHGKFRARDALGMIAGGLLPVFTHGSLPAEQQNALMELFGALDIAAAHELASSAIDHRALDKDIGRALVKIQTAFPLTVCTSAMHQMSHLGGLWRRFGSLYNTSMWDFESIFGVLKRLVHGGRDRDVEMTNKLAAADLASLVRMRTDMDYLDETPEAERPSKRVKSLHPAAKPGALDPDFLKDSDSQRIECTGSSVVIDLEKLSRGLHNMSCQFSYTFRTISAAIEQYERESGANSRSIRRRGAIARAKLKFGSARVEAVVGHVASFVQSCPECFLELKVPVYPCPLIVTAT